eukprot:TRINITY_DN112702_c0_g1_i1.p1 TRINITY_DN112702_c0_g1~~TRINITY_DN112702_c0_g1_i1.p1  ORF type:complete len:188 (-),score=45.50 TRINITY_DN112702_c0_g1_i1:104-667(-)
MTNVPLGPGGWHYEKGFRVAISGLGSKATKPLLQQVFGEFGHILKIETPRSGQSVYLSYQDRRDAEDAIKMMDGETVEGAKVEVRRAGERPPPGASGVEGEGKAEGKGEGRRPAPTEREESKGPRKAEGREGRGKESKRKSRSRSPADKGDKTDKGRKGEKRDRSRSRRGGRRRSPSKSRSRGRRRR